MTGNASDLSARSAALLEQIKSELNPGLEDSLQKELAELVNLIPDFVNLKYPDLLQQSEIAVAALLTDPPNVQLATEIRKHISKRVRQRRNPLLLLSRGIRRGTPPTRVIAGLGLLFYFAIPLIAAAWPALSDRKEILGINAEMLGIVAIFGAMGSIVSIMVRLKDFAKATDTDPAILFFTGLFKPIVGIAFALFVFAVLSSGLLPVTIEPEKERFFFAAISFVAGFSERFAKDIAAKTEQAIGS